MEGEPAPQRPHFWGMREKNAAMVACVAATMCEVVAVLGPLRPSAAPLKSVHACGRG